MSFDCPHVAEIRPVPDGGTVCPSCVEIGGTWVNLRQCLVCGQVGCCDSSPNTHATRHNQASGHPVMRSIMPDEDWMWCHVCELLFRERNGRYVEVDGFFDAGLWFAHRLPSGTSVADIAPDALMEGGFPLGTWVTTYRERGREGALDDDQRAALEAIPGWSW